MATQTGFVTLRGKTGDQIYYKRNGKSLARSAAKSTKQTNATKESSKDFGRANSATALIRKTFKPILEEYQDSTFDDRLKSKLINIINTGPRELRGKLEITDGDIALLKTIEFNKYASVRKITNFIPRVEINNAENLIIRIPKLSMKDLFHNLERCKYAYIELMCGIFHFDLKKAGWMRPDIIKVPLDKEYLPGGKFNIPLQAAENSVVAVAMGVGFLTDNGLPVGDRRFYAGKIIEAINIVNGEIVQFKYPEKIRKEIDIKPETRIAFEPDEE